MQHIHFIYIQSIFYKINQRRLSYRLLMSSLSIQALKYRLLMSSLSTQALKLTRLILFRQPYLRFLSQQDSLQKSYYYILLPLIPILESKTKGSQFTANFRLESDAIMISQDRTQYSLLSEHEYKLCANQVIKQCLITSARYKTNWNKHCVVAMFVNEHDRMKESCTKVVSQNEGLPVVQY